MKNPAKTKKHWLVLTTICLMYASTLGLGANTMGVYYTPVAESLDILRGDFAMNQTISALVSGVFSLVVPQLLNRYKWKIIIAIGILLTFIGVFGMGLTTSVSLFNLLGVARGIGIAMTTFVAGAALINEWFEEKNGLAISLAASFSGVAGIVFSPLFTWLIPNLGWQNTLFVHGGLILLLGLPAILLPYSFRPEDEGLWPYGATESRAREETEKKKTQLQWKDYLRVASLSLIVMAALQTAVVGMNQHLPSYGASVGMNLEVTGLILSAVMLGNMFFKLLTGAIIDRIGAIQSMVLLIALNIAALFLMTVWTSAFGLIINAFLYGSIFGTAVLYVTLPRELFGAEAGNQIYAVMIFSASLAIAFSNAAIGYIYDFTGSYVSVFWMGIALQLISVWLVFVAKKYALETEAD